MTFAKLATTALLIASILCSHNLTHAAGKANLQKTGQIVPNFELKDFRGKSFDLSEIPRKKVVVLAFLGTQCPLAKLYSVRLSKLAEEYRDKDIVIWGVNSNRQDSITEIMAFVRDHKVSFPMLKDAGNRVADLVNAERTPEVVVLDSQRIIRYRGRVDDQYGIGYAKDEPQQNDLKNAIDDLLAGKTVEVPVTPLMGCHIGRIKTPNPNSKVTYSNQIARIFQKRCVECHREGEIAPFELTDYDEVVGWAEMIAEVVQEDRMPPWHASKKAGHFANDRALSKLEKSQIIEWVKNGAPQGDMKELPEAVSFVDDWQLPKEPDKVFPMDSKPFQIPAEGVVRYKYFKVDTNFKEDKWVKAFQVVPGNRQVVHHVLVIARRPGERIGGGASGFLAAYVPGLRSTPFPEGMAKRIPAGSELIFQLHYTPIGTDQEDMSSIAMVFADPKSITHEVKTTSALQRRLSIPPNEKAHRVDAQTAQSAMDFQLLSMNPHMHLRGSAYRYEAVFPNGKKEVLLDIPHYDFNWQTSYVLEKPKQIPKGTFIKTTALFDNSKNNLNNPDPTKTVRWGDQTWEEMMIGYFEVAFPVSNDTKKTPFPKRKRR